LVGGECCLDARDDCFLAGIGERGPSALGPGSNILAEAMPDHGRVAVSLAHLHLERAGKGAHYLLSPTHRITA
jgi:hypothetical protein